MSPRLSSGSFMLFMAFHAAPAEAQSLSTQAPAPARVNQHEAGRNEPAADSDQHDTAQDWQLPVIPAAPPTVLTTREVEAVRLSRGWQNHYSPAMLGRNGKVVYHFGESSAPVITAPGNVTHIELEQGEVLVEDGIFIGDSVNWRIIPVAQGEGDQVITHIVVKPTYENLETTMIAITDRRSYYFHLKSTADQFMASVGFEYPEIEARHWHEYGQSVNAAKEVEASRREERAIEVTSTIRPDIADLDFGYSVSGDNPAWKPVRVYNDGLRVYIQMPESMRQSDAPAFIETGPRNTTQIVNYRLRRGTFIVDKLFTRGMLVAGTGRNQRKVIIMYTGG